MFGAFALDFGIEHEFQTSMAGNPNSLTIPVGWVFVLANRPCEFPNPRKQTNQTLFAQIVHAVCYSRDVIDTVCKSPNDPYRLGIDSRLDHEPWGSRTLSQVGIAFVEAKPQVGPQQCARGRRSENMTNSDSEDLPDCLLL